MSPLRRVVDQPTWLLSRANVRAQSLLAAAFATEGVRGYQFRLLAAIEEFGPSSQADLGRHTGIDRSDIVAALDDLVDRRLAERRQDEADRRRNVVTLTRGGRATLKRLDAVLASVQEAVLEPLPQEDRKALLGFLRQLG